MQAVPRLTWTRIMDKKSLIALVLLLGAISAAVQAGRDLKTPTPSSSLLTAQDAQNVVSGQEMAQRIWDEEKARLGDTLQARHIAVGRIASLPGVRGAGVNATGSMIWIEYDTGIKGGVMTQPEGTKGIPTLDAGE